jgi:hypothetical protein
MSRFTRVRQATVGIVAFMGLGLLAMPGAATTAAADAPAPGLSPGSPMLPGPGGPVPNTAAGMASGAAVNPVVISNNWSGYAAQGSTYTSVSSNWVEPAATCTSSTTQVAGFWVGLDGYGNSTVEQTGTAMECSGGSPVYWAWYEMYPAGSVNIAHPVVPGDVMSASVNATSPTTFVISISDATQGWNFATTQTAATAPARSSAEVITEAPCCVSGSAYPLADFTKVSYTKSHVNGLPLYKALPVRINMHSTTGVHQDLTSGLTGGNFSDTWLHS